MGMWDSFKEAIGFRTKKIEEATSSARDPKKTKIARLGQAVGSGGSGGGFEDSPVDFGEIQRAYHTDSYISRAIDKHAGLMLKNGWDFNGKNEEAVNYIWTRLKLMSEATDKPTDQLISQLVFDFVLYGNAYLVKARAKNAQAMGGVNATGYTGKQPISGYFILPPTTVRIERDEQGTIVAYEQDSGTGDAVTFAPTEVIHFTYRQPTGRAYGVPLVFNVLDDVLVLRQLEENVARLVYRNLFPVYAYQVGLDKDGFQASDEEIESLREEIRDMPMDGAIVIPERHNISVIGAEGQAIEASGYLEYYRQRVFTGLNVSDTVMGVGGTANRSTSDNQAADLFDGVKEFQRLFMEQFQHYVINELLFEGGYDPVLVPEDEVTFFFEEIELDAKIKRENHMVQLFTQNVIDHDELRALVGLEPATDLSKFYFNMVTVGVAKATASTSGEGEEVDTSGQEAANNAGQNKDQPTNQNGTQSSPGKPKADLETSKMSISEKVDEKVLTEGNVMVNLTTELPINSYVESMNKIWNNLSEDASVMIQRGKSVEEVKAFSIELMRQSLRGRNQQFVSSALMKGSEDAQRESGKRRQSNIFTLTQSENVTKKSQGYVERLIDDITRLIEKSYEIEDVNEKLSYVQGAFRSNKYRLSFIANTELYRAYNYGKILTAKELGMESVNIIHEDGCKQCEEKQGQVSLAVTDLLEVIPPHHANCKCLVQLNMPAEEV